MTAMMVMMELRDLCRSRRRHLRRIAKTKLLIKKTWSRRRRSQRKFRLKAVTIKSMQKMRINSKRPRDRRVHVS